VTPAKKQPEKERYILDAFLRHPICSRRLSELRTEHFAAYRDERLKLIKPASLKRQLDPIRNMFEIARDEWGIPLRENPLAKLRLHVPPNRRERRLREGELEGLLYAAKARRNPLIVPIILFAVETGMRRGEILAIHWDHIDWKHRSLLIPESKNGYSRTIPLTPGAVGILEGMRDQEKGTRPCTHKRASADDRFRQNLRSQSIDRVGQQCGQSD